ncbi:MAG: hypothetical protein Q9193_001511 [Seirophora villosa]
MQTENIKAAIKFGHGGILSSGNGNRVTFEILGGVEFPRLMVSLRVPEHGASMQAVFRPWHPTFRSFPNPPVYLKNLNSVGELLGGFFGFSERMHSLTVQVHDSPEPQLRSALALTGPRSQTFPCATWQCHRKQVSAQSQGIHFMSAVSLAERSGLGHIPPTNTPTSSHWDGSAMFELPVLPFYVDARHFEVIQHSVMVRDDQLASEIESHEHRNVTCNGHYDFRLEMFESLQIQAQQSCIITITVGGHHENKVFPESGSAVAIKLGNMQEIAGHSTFTGEVLNHGGREHPNQIRMLVVLPAGPGFVLSAPTGSWRAYFRIDLYGSQVTRTCKALQIFTVQRPDSWLTRLFLGHAPLDPLSPHATRSRLNFDMTATIHKLNGPQQSVLATAIALDPQDTFTAARHSICQAPSDTGKSHLIIALVHRNYRIIHLQTEATEDLRAIQVRQQIQVVPALPAIEGPSAQGSRVGQTPTHHHPNNPAAQAQSLSESGSSDGSI